MRQLDDMRRTVYFMNLSNLSNWPSRIELASRHFGVLLLCDGRALSTEILSTVAARIIDQGLAYLCVWGPDCERIHDIFDEVLIGDGAEPSRDNPVVMTTSHDESMEEAVWFALYLSVPAGHYEKTCRSWVVASIGQPEWAEEAMRLTTSLDWNS